VIANSTRMSLPRLDGKEFPRAVQPAGIIYYDAKGSEMGGLALTDASMGRIGALSFDYPQWDAIGLLSRQSSDGKESEVGLQINSRPRVGADVMEAAKTVQTRLVARNRNEKAEIILSDPAGRDRIRLRVDEQGTPSIEMLDADGKVIYRAPAAVHP
jgi:hypothetical protein